MKKIIERTKFAIAWQKTNKDQDRDMVIIRIRYHRG